MVRPFSAWARAALLVCLLGGSATASVETESGYTKAQAYNAALRYLRVDLSYEVTEKDADAAYLLFRFVPEGRKVATNGAIEIVEQHAGVRLYVRLPEMPTYREQVMSDELMRKLHSEYGDPPRHDDSPPKDRDKDKDGDRDKDRDGDKDKDGDHDKDPDKDKGKQEKPDEHHDPND